MSRTVTYTYHLNLAERGCFACDVRNSKGRTVWEINFDGDEEESVDDYEGIPIPWRDGYRGPEATSDELYELQKYLKEIGKMPESAELELEKF